MNNLDKIAFQTKKALIEAGKIFSGKSIEKKDITEKGFGNYVTVIDYNVQKLLVPKFKEIIPSSNVITEESKDNNYSIEKPTWILDPVDGTTNLIYDMKHSAISVGLFIDEKPALGFVYNPSRNEMFFAQKNKGAYLNGEKIKVSNAKSIKNSLISFGTSPYNRKKAGRTFDIAKNIFLSCRDLRRCGAASLDLAYTACGRLDGFFEMELQPWDFAGGKIILEEAGGKITDFNGKSIDVCKPGPVIATNGFIHEEILKYF